MPSDHTDFITWFKVNGENRKVNLRGADTLLEVLRKKLGLTAAKPGCENGDCGSCTVLVDGVPMHACLVLAVEMTGCEITTLEGLKGTPVQKAFLHKMAFQCGYCTPGIILNSYALLQLSPHPDDKTIKEWLNSNLCRCTSYQEMKEALLSVDEKAGKGGKYGYDS